MIAQYQKAQISQPINAKITTLLSSFYVAKSNRVQFKCGWWLYADHNFKTKWQSLLHKHMEGHLLLFIMPQCCMCGLSGCKDFTTLQQHVPSCVMKSACVSGLVFMLVEGKHYLWFEVIKQELFFITVIVTVQYQSTVY